ncbi:hypothetical protein ACH9D2_18835 [Kocuria sp. M4R2S49]|uniref:hypothetical protein n=1 Tax=Kocuria rhizosphaericola TaxID=3376284 RepID=UPI0037B65D83
MAVRFLDHRLSDVEKDGWRWLKGVPLRWWIRGAVTVVAVLTLAYLLGGLVGWMDGYRSLLDRFWAGFDFTAERARLAALIVGALIPGIVAWVAYRTYSADYWWKRAQWAMDSATDKDKPERIEFGKRAITHLLAKNKAPKRDIDLFTDVVTGRFGSQLEGIAARAAQSDPALRRALDEDGPDDTPAGTTGMDRTTPVD